MPPAVLKAALLAEKPAFELSGVELIQSHSSAESTHQTGENQPRDKIRPPQLAAKVKSIKKKAKSADPKQVSKRRRPRKTLDVKLVPEVKGDVYPCRHCDAVFERW